MLPRPRSYARTTRQERQLVYVADSDAGYSRRRRGAGFVYVTSTGRPVQNAALCTRFRALAIPPAWTSVWICRRSTGHIQATGFDARGRKQYLYHPDWRMKQDHQKFDRVVEFGRALPRLRRYVTAALKLPGLPREKVLAAALRLLDRAGLRVGNKRYASENGSFGLTTLTCRHLRRAAGEWRLTFRGKSGIRQQVRIEDAELCQVIRECSELPGQRLFQYVDDAGLRHAIGSSDVNRQIRAWTGGDFSAKDFRTWVGSVAFLRASRVLGAESPASLKGILQVVAQTLGNTPAICRKSYVHPLLIDMIRERTLPPLLASPKPRRLARAERDLLSVLEGAQVPARAVRSR